MEDLIVLICQKYGSHRLHWSDEKKLYRKKHARTKRLIVFQCHHESTSWYYLLLPEYELPKETKDSCSEKNN